MGDRTVVITKLISLPERSARSANKPVRRRAAVLEPCERRFATHSGQTAASKPVSQSSQCFRELEHHKADVGGLTQSGHLRAFDRALAADIRTSVPLSYQTLPCRNVPSCFGGPIGDA